MTLPAPNTIAIVGAGPIGLEAAAAALDLGFDVHVFERGDVGAHAIAWGHVRMFTPWRMNLGPASLARLTRSGWTPPPADEAPTGLELAERYLQPLAALPEIAPRLHTHSRVVHVGRRGLLKGDGEGARRADHPFRLVVRDQSGRESYLHAFALIDASGVYGQPNWAGDGGIPARGETYLAPQLSYHLDDVLGLRRQRYAGVRTVVIGGGSGAATVVADLAKLAAQVPGTAAIWITREPAEVLYRDDAGDPLARRRELFAEARALLGGANPSVRHVGGAVVEAIQYNSATHRYTTVLVRGDAAASEESEQVIVNAGYGPDATLYRELQTYEGHPINAPIRPGTGIATSEADCRATPPPDAATLAQPEPNFLILGHKAHGRSPCFLLETGYAQVGAALAKLAADRGLALVRSK